MGQRHTDSTRKPTGGRTRRNRKPRKHEQGGEATETTVGETAVATEDAHGRTEKHRVKRADTINVATDGETEPMEIEAVLENEANPDLVRRDIVTKGAVVDTPAGKARVTSRPGQDGTVNGVILDE